MKTNDKEQKAVELREMVLSFHNRYSIWKILIEKAPKQQQKYYNIVEKVFVGIVFLIISFFMFSWICPLGSINKFTVFGIQFVILILLLAVNYIVRRILTAKFYSQSQKNKFNNKKLDKSIQYQIQKNKFREKLEAYSYCRNGNFYSELHQMLLADQNDIRFLAGRKKWFDYIVDIMFPILMSGIVFCTLEFISLERLGVEYTDDKRAVLQIALQLVVFLPFSILVMCFFCTDKIFSLRKPKNIVTIRILEELMLEEKIEENL